MSAGWDTNVGYLHSPVTDPSVTTAGEQNV